MLSICRLGRFPRLRLQGSNWVGKCPLRAKLPAIAQKNSSTSLQGPAAVCGGACAVIRSCPYQRKTATSIVICLGGNSKSQIGESRRLFPVKIAEVCGVGRCGRSSMIYLPLPGRRRRTGSQRHRAYAESSPAFGQAAPITARSRAAKSNAEPTSSPSKGRERCGKIG